MAINRELSQFGRLVQIIDNVSIGIGTTSNVSIGFGTISATTFSGSNILVGTATSTGTASQRLQVTGGAYVSGSVGIGTTNPGSTLDVRATGATIRVQNPAAANYSVLLDPSAVGPRVSFGVNADSSFMEFGAYNLFNNLDTKNRDLKIFSTAVPNAFILRQATGNIGIGTTNPSDKLHVLGSNIRIDSASGSLNFWSGAGFYGGIGVLNAFGGSGTDIVLRADSGRSLIFQTGGANDRGRIDANGTFLVGSATSTGTASQRLQVTGGAYVSGNLGVGVTNPASKIDVWSTTSGSTAIRATSSPSFSSTLYPGVISGLSTTGSGFPNFAASGIGVTSGEIGVYSFFPTFANYPADRGPRRAVDLVGGFSTGVWGTEYFSINVGRNGASNDSSILTSEKLRITASGNVGIGTTNPTSALDIVGNAKVSGVVTATKFVGDGSLLTNLPSGGSSGGGTSSQWTTGATGITTTSNVGIKSTTPTSALDVTGDVKVSGIITATDFNSSSDINLKTNIQTIENPISKLFEINGVTFNWIENEKASVGVIAQDVEKALPQLVNDMGSHKVVNYNGLIGLLVECIKHQQRQIDELKEHMIGS
jgi:hypothetical protein